MNNNLCSSAQQCEDNDNKKSENLKRMFVETVLQTRKIYLEHHEKNPGFFSLVVTYICIYIFIL